jgi:hypothetical protein
MSSAPRIGEATVPTTIGLERATNPFMRAASVEEFAQRRSAKDNFRGESAFTRALHASRRLP